ncbi:YwqJ-related putative deaminase [Frankia sp. R82]|uniref:YwqJ-related putative deaminase n=1 Tax=Frankia sp. R82 TaxID=2950553 RepID=UPI002044636A|nr:YwqJ-related putative deaminase [Frankia sp. R82]MCM3882849.1 YwqJ-related putative deaminase [Frankia sp. R82]
MATDRPSTTDAPPPPPPPPPPEVSTQDKAAALDGDDGFQTSRPENRQATGGQAEAGSGTVEDTGNERQDAAREHPTATDDQTHTTTEARTPAAWSSQDKIAALDRGDGTGKSDYHDIGRSDQARGTPGSEHSEIPEPTDTVAVQPAAQTTQDKLAALDGDPLPPAEQQDAASSDPEQPAASALLREHEPQGLEPPRQGLEPTPEFQAALDERKAAIDDHRIASTESNGVTTNPPDVTNGALDSEPVGTDSEKPGLENKTRPDKEEGTPRNSPSGVETRDGTEPFGANDRGTSTTQPEIHDPSDRDASNAPPVGDGARTPDDERVREDPQDTDVPAADPPPNEVSDDGPSEHRPPARSLAGTPAEASSPATEHDLPGSERAGSEPLRRTDGAGDSKTSLDDGETQRLPAGAGSDFPTTQRDRDRASTSTTDSPTGSSGTIDPPGAPDDSGASTSPEAPLTKVQPLPRLTESQVDRSENGLIEKIDGKPVREYLHDLADERRQGYWDARDDHSIPKSRVAPVVSDLLDKRTGLLYESTNSITAPEDLHPILRERLNTLKREAQQNPQGYQYPRGDRGGYPHFSVAGSHAEVLNVSRALHDRERMGYQVSAESLSEMLVDNYFPYRPDEKSAAPCCANCTAILGDRSGVESIPGKLSPNR